MNKHGDIMGDVKLVYIKNLKGHDSGVRYSQELWDILHAQIFVSKMATVIVKKFMRGRK